MSKQDYIFISPTSKVNSVTFPASCSQGECGKVEVEFSCYRKYKDYGFAGSWHSLKGDQIENKPNGNITFYYTINTFRQNKSLNIVSTIYQIDSETVLHAPSHTGQNECAIEVIQKRILPLNGKSL